MPHANGGPVVAPARQIDAQPPGLIRARRRGRRIVRGRDVAPGFPYDGLLLIAGAQLKNHAAGVRAVVLAGHGVAHEDPRGDYRSRLAGGRHDQDRGKRASGHGCVSRLWPWARRPRPVAAVHRQDTPHLAVPDNRNRPDPLVPVLLSGGRGSRGPVCTVAAHAQSAWCRRVLPMFLAVLCAASATCGGSAALTTNPSPVKCAVTAAASPSELAGTGGAGSVTITAQPECAWTASTPASWITNLTPASGQGNGQVKFQVEVNPGHTSRQDDVFVNDQSGPGPAGRDAVSIRDLAAIAIGRR